MLSYSENYCTEPCNGSSSTGNATRPNIIVNREITIIIDEACNFGFIDARKKSDTETVGNTYLKTIPPQF